MVFSERPRQAPVSFWTRKEPKGTSDPGLFSLNLLGFKPHMIFWEELEFETEPGCLSVQGSLVQWVENSSNVHGKEQRVRERRLSWRGNIEAEDTKSKLEK